MPVILWLFARKCNCPYRQCTNTFYCICLFK